MSWIPAFEIGVWNAWLFMIVYPLQWALVIIVPKNIAEKTGHPEGLKQAANARLFASLTNIVWLLATLYSIFLPLQTGTAWLYVGLAVFIIGVIIVVDATLRVYHTPADAPFTGGIYRETTGSLVGPFVNKMLDELHIDKVFISARGISPDKGITDPNIQEIEVKRAMVQAAKETYLLIDHSKFGDVAFCSIIPLEKLKAIITDRVPPPGFEEIENRVPLIVPDK